ncbi:respiratory nitrate reductase subunit gamma [Nocardia sp. 2]|uniref:Respiratory nitrate reductase subunit gamma n=1 Tax=Nocardia acididurans TaxID=2802282 RepID=A0ABS1M8V4_9NOCA|nr:respiratory nitrate reductase subunit gamma [Nocardia acididurans]MBL1077026.1 respiratory nitrate reductase subunit gamma [Nocardia acididurans]
MTQPVSTADILLWVAIPYAALAAFVVGLIWRYRYDKFGWTTRSSQIYENRLLRLGSPLFHYGVIVVFFGHVIGLAIPEGWTEAVGINEHTYHLVSYALGAPAGIATVVGLIILIYRRRTVGSVFSATTRNDKIMYVLLGLTLIAGLSATLYGNLTGNPHNYRADIAPWLRSIFSFRPKPEYMTTAPMLFRLHVLAACALFAFWPFSRLVHVFSAPVWYLTRPYIVYRSRAVSGPGAHKPARGWERV